YRVKDCQPRRIAAVEPHLQPNGWSRFEFVARVVDLPSPARGVQIEGSSEPFVAAAYVWNFGDGESATTAVPVAAHDYEERAQDALYSYFVAGVTVHARD